MFNERESEKWSLEVDWQIKEGFICLGLVSFVCFGVLSVFKDGKYYNISVCWQIWSNRKEVFITGERYNTHYCDDFE